MRAPRRASLYGLSAGAPAQPQYDYDDFSPGTIPPLLEYPPSVLGYRPPSRAAPREEPGAYPEYDYGDPGPQGAYGPPPLDDEEMTQKAIGGGRSAFAELAESRVRGRRHHRRSLISGEHGAFSDTPLAPLRRLMHRTFMRTEPPQKYSEGTSQGMSQGVTQAMPQGTQQGVLQRRHLFRPQPMSPEKLAQQAMAHAAEAQAEAAQLRIAMVPIERAIKKAAESATAAAAEVNALIEHQIDAQSGLPMEKIDKAVLRSPDSLAQAEADDAIQAAREAIRQGQSLHMLEGVAGEEPRGGGRWGHGGM